VRVRPAAGGITDAPSRASIEPSVVVVGIGADGWAGLGEPGRAALTAARTIVGSQRQLDLLPAELEAARRPWPSPIDPLVEELVTARHDGTCVLASGDPMLYGIGATLAARLGPERLVVHPHPSAFALACARLGWPAAEVELVSAVGRPLETLIRLLQPRRRIVVYASGADGSSRVARLLRERGFGPSRFIVLEQLGAPDERVHESTAEQWGKQVARQWAGQSGERPDGQGAGQSGERPDGQGAGRPGEHPLQTVAVECRLASGALPLPPTPGLPDAAFQSDGQLTKQPVRAIALAALAPLPGELLWDVGAGSGSIAIEWLRAEPSARAIAIEANAQRVERIAANASALGVPQLDVRHGRAPAALDGLPAPDAVFIGGGVSQEGTIERCWQALRPGGRLVANAVTLEGEQALLAARAAHGGELLRIECSDAEPLGGFTGWRPRRPVVQWSVPKGRAR
jgi:precorrin-6B C5,15-methyltransferase / cobalt-precorrin-6B C5,C15-methyltransferase